ncbi:MAG TPA: hypothetical protein VK510_07490 [Solirubrobacteraceae bacterium]|nr:hypothetical protein [Solirubrobacteraceae bacterium]
MSAVAPPADVRDARAGTARARIARVLASADTRALAALGLLFAVLTALTWRKWGVPEIDAGHELTTADRIAHGAEAYRDVRYFYGPAGLYSLAAAFKVFGVSFTTAYAFGLVQAAAILGAFYALARRLLPALTAALATAVLATIGFSGTAFNFVLPHTNSATFGILFLLLMLLGLSRERLVLAGLAAGVVGLSRPEFAAVAALTGAAFLVGLWRDRGMAVVLRALPRLAVPAIAVAGGVLTVFAAGAGASTLFTENLWPVDFLRVTKFGSQSQWAPFDVASVASTLARAAIYCSLLAALVASAIAASRRTGAARVRALWPLAATGALLLAGMLAWRVLGVFPDARSAVQSECRHLIIGMSWLPALGFGTAALTALRLVRGGRAPLSGAWAFDLALVAAAAALGARAYDAFTGDVSYAPYYAAPLVLLLGVLHQRVGERWPAARQASMLALGAVAAGMAAYSLIGLYPDQSTAVHTARGTVMMNAQAARAFQPTVDYIERNTRPGEPILAVPADAGLYFMTGRVPALYDVMFIPGLLDSRADEQLAIARLRREGVRLAVVGKRRFVGYGTTTFGADYNRLLAGEITGSGAPVATFGDPSKPAAGGTNPSEAYRIYRLR